MSTIRTKDDNEGLKISAYLWSCPDLPHWKRLAFFWFFIPMLLWYYLLGKPVLIGKWVDIKTDEIPYLMYRKKILSTDA